MRIERWYWLGLFCLMSLGIHVGLILKSRAFEIRVPTPNHTEIEVALQPLPEPAAKPKPEPKLKPPPKPKIMPEPKTERVVARPMAARRIVRGTPFAPTPRPKLERKEQKRPPKNLVARAPVAPNREPGGMERLRDEKPLPSGLAIGRKEAAPALRIARSMALPGGGGSPAPGPRMGGRGGAPEPEAPPEDVIYSGGGAGGEKLPKEAPRIGGGGGRSILSVNNPLAKEAIPEDKPGLGPGTGQGEGAGAGGGTGYGRGKGIGTRLDGKYALATLRSKPGPGVGAGQGDKIGTRPPGGNRGTGAELPGTGGTGLGYGRGKGVGIGNGGGAGVGDGSGGGRGHDIGLTRGIPFGDIAGLLKGDPDGGGGTGGGPGGSGRGGVFGARPRTGGAVGKDPVHIVYVLDSSTSMMEGDKMGKAKEALKKALSELKPKDTFNILHFDHEIYAFSPFMRHALPSSVEEANEFVDNISMSHNTFLSGALEVALSLPGITHIFLLSDGEPHGGIEDPEELRAMVRQRNTQKVKIITLALGLGEQFPGIPLLKAIADENGGQFSYINLAR